MKRLAIMLFVGLAATVGRASPCWVGLPTPGDKISTEITYLFDKAAVAQMRADGERYYPLEGRLKALGGARLLSLFPEIKPPVLMDGKPWSADYPWVADGYAVPTWRMPEIAYNGFGHLTGADAVYKSRFLTISSVAGVVVYCYEKKGNAPEILGLALTLKRDDAFVPLNTAADYPARRKWEAERMPGLEKSIEKALKKAEK